jgi:hypothetical protein
MKLDATIQVDHTAAFDAGIAQHGSLTALNDYLRRGNREVYTYLIEEIDAEAAGLNTDHIPRPASYPRDMKVNTAIRCAAVVRVPQLDKALQEVEWGLSPAKVAMTESCIQTRHSRSTWRNIAVLKTLFIRVPREFEESDERMQKLSAEESISYTAYEGVDGTVLYVTSCVGNLDHLYQTLVSCYTVLHISRSARVFRTASLSKKQIQ